MKEKSIKSRIEKGASFLVGVRYNADIMNYSVYLMTSEKKYIDEIEIWAGDREKTFVDPRKIIPWAEKLGFHGVCFDDIIFD